MLQVCVCGGGQKLQQGDLLGRVTFRWGFDSHFQGQLELVKRSQVHVYTVYILSQILTKVEITI